MSQETRELEAKVGRAHRAHELLTDPLLIEAWAKVEERILSIWRATKSPQGEDREFLWQQLRAVDLVRAALTSYVNTGKFASESLAQKRMADAGGSESRP